MNTTPNQRIQELREKAGLTQTELAKRLGVTRAAVSQWETALSIPSLNFVIELSKLFNVSIDYVLGLNDIEAVNIGHLDDEQKKVIYSLVKCFSRDKN